MLLLSIGSFNSCIKTDLTPVLTGITGLKSQNDSLLNMVINLKKTLDSLQVQANTNTGLLIGLNARINNLQTSISSLLTSINSLNTKIDTLNNNLDSVIVKLKGITTQYQALSTQISSVFNALSVKIDSLSLQVAGNTSGINLLENQYLKTQIKVDSILLIVLNNNQLLTTNSSNIALIEQQLLQLTSQYSNILSLLNQLIALINNQAPASLNIGLVVYYPFSGNAIDSSGNGYNGTVTGATLTADRFGNANSAYNFTGASQYISTSYAGISGTTDRTFSLWFKQSSLNNGSNEWPLFNYGGSTQGFAVMIFPVSTPTASNKIGIDIGNSYVVYNPTPVLNQWHHLAITYSSTFGTNVLACKIYLDNALLSSVATQFNPTLTLNTLTGVLNLTIGANPSLSTAQFLGAIDDVKIWNRVLTLSEIAYLGTH